MVWMSSSCTTHFISSAENKRCSWISVGKKENLKCRGKIWKTERLISFQGKGPTRWRPAPRSILKVARHRAVLALPSALHHSPVSAADGVLIIRTWLNIQGLLGYGVLRSKQTRVKEAYEENLDKWWYEIFPHQLFVSQAVCCIVLSISPCWSPC